MATNIVGKQARRLRYDLGLTQEQMTAKCQRAGLDVSRGTYAKIESGVRGMTDIEIAQLARALKVAPGDLFPQAKK